MLSCSAEVEIYASLDEVWSKLANFELYPNWSLCFASVTNVSSSSVSFVDSKLRFDFIRLKERIRRVATIEEFSAPHCIVYSFTRPYAFWLKEIWHISLQTTESENTLVSMEVRYSGWTHVTTYQFEGPLIQSFCEAHLEALKEELEKLGDVEDDDFFIEE